MHAKPLARRSGVAASALLHSAATVTVNSARVTPEMSPQGATDWSTNRTACG
jgi:hypothetical protein